MSRKELTMETYREGDGAHLGRWYRLREGKREYLSDFDLWMCEDLLGKPYSGLYLDED